MRSGSAGVQADNPIAFYEGMTWEHVRLALERVAKRDGEWAGIPCPLDGQRLVMDPLYPKAEALAALNVACLKTEVKLPHWTDGLKHRNTFWSWKWRADVAILERPDGRITYGLIPAVHGLGYAMETMRSADAWSLETEERALATLKTLTSNRQYHQYMLTGMFLEKSRRSGHHYIFRKLRPTVVLRHPGEDGNLDILCTLCLHPIAYYSGSWAGAMCPTDDVLAHLMLMRGDEPMFWRRANQHAAYRPESGL